MEDSKFKQNVMYKLGRIEGKVEDMDNKLSDVCITVASHSEKVGDIEEMKSNIKTHKEKLSKHDVVLGKWGAALATVIFGINIAIVFVADWVKDKLFR